MIHKWSSCLRISQYSYSQSIDKRINFLRNKSLNQIKNAQKDAFIEALKKHGLLKGLLIGVKRILRCQPWGSSGVDPVPPVRDKKLEKKLHANGKCIAPRHSQRYIGPSTILPIRENDI